MCVRTIHIDREGGGSPFLRRGCARELAALVHPCGAEVLQRELPPLHEFVVVVPLTQVTLCYCQRRGDGRAQWHQF